MKTRLFAGAIALALFAASLLAGPRDAQWKEVENAYRKGLPKTAIEQLELIISSAQTDKAHAEAVKAITRKIALEGGIQGNKAEEKITRFQAELANAPAAMRPAMEAILAHWYWQYFQQNRWKFSQRTATASSPGPDIQTWDLARILAEIDQHFNAALADEAMLKATPITEYDELLEEGNVPASYRPTLFDFLAYEALRFYQAGEHAGSKAEEEFEITANSPIFADTATFITWKPETSDIASPKLKAIRLYQALLQFHHSDTNREAFFDADLARLTYGNNVSIGEAKSDRYKAALKRFVASTIDLEVSSRALAALGSLLNTEGEPAEAHRRAQTGLDSFPGSAGGTLCYNLIQQIEAKSAALTTESVWNAPWPTLNLTYRNVTKVHFRAIPLDFVDQLEHKRDEKDLLKGKPALEWSANLPPTSDFKYRTEKLPAPTSLKPGYYLVAASHDPAFSENNNQIVASFVWVSDLALISETEHGNPTHSGLVLNAVNGEPAVGATVHFWTEERNRSFREIATTETDENGGFEFPSKEQSFIIFAEHEGQAVATPHAIYSDDREYGEQNDSLTVFFTDRALYRPGQTINYKGVSIRFDQNAGKYSALADKKLIVVFNDPYGKEIARTEHRTNDYGSFSGVFTAPRDRLMGNMTIQVLGLPSSTSFNVEEYKRPKFQVEINAPTDAVKLGTPVVITGKATAYTGAALGNAKVKWRVERTVRCPYWCWWWRPAAQKAIAHGTATTEPDGTFKVEFPATPDRTVPTKNEPVFAFSLHADVTDTTGETRSADRTIRVGYAAMQATLDTKEWQTPDKPVELTVTTRSLDSSSLPANGTVTIHALKQPTAVERAPLQPERFQWRLSDNGEPKSDPTNPDSWELGSIVYDNTFKTDTTGKILLTAQLKAGFYRASLVTQDRFGKAVTARCTLQVIDPRESRLSAKIPNHFSSPSWSVEPGETFAALWGTGYDKGRAFVELECNGKPLKSYWTPANRTQELIKLPVTESMRGGFTLRVTYVRENRAYLNQQIVSVPWSNKQLAVKWETFRSKLLPGQKETWTAVVTGPNSKRAAAEMVATLYDASLDQYMPHEWPGAFSVFRQESTHGFASFQNSPITLQNIHAWQQPTPRAVDWYYRAFPREILSNTWGWEYVRAPGGSSIDTGSIDASSVVLSPFEVAVVPERGYMAIATLSSDRPKTKGVKAAETPPPPPPPDLSKVAARKNLNETAFFFPQLVASDDGVVRMTFTMPEALTEWRFLGFAHDKQLRSGFLTDKVTTSKDLMVEPNPPRFVREGDTIEFTVKVSNQSDLPQAGTVKLSFADAASLKPVDSALGLRDTEQSFAVPAKQSRTFSWRIAVPDGLGFLIYKAVAATAQFSDGEEGFLPVLSRRTLVTESLPLSIRGKSTKPYAFEKLLASGSSNTLRHQSLTVQMTSQPAWYAVMALPYLMEFPYECSEQIFNRFYSNTLARHIANSDPKVRRVFDLWKNTPALDSPLEKNQDLKSLMLEETPWLREAKAESEARRKVGLLFDTNRLDEESTRTLSKLAERQGGDGLWSWFPGGSSSEYISLYIVTGFGRLRYLGVDVDISSAIKALAALDADLNKSHRNILTHPKPEEYIPDATDALYLYGRSFFLKERPIAAREREAVDFFLRQARKNWVKAMSRQTQAHLALALQRFGDTETALAIVKSLKERSVNSEELGRFWNDSELTWWWYHAPIETQALMIEAFAEIANDTQAVEDCKVWLLKQKQTQDWKTTKATADAIYGLLLRGSNLPASDALVEVALAGETIKPDKVEAGTGFYEKKFTAAEIKPAQGKITVKKTDDGVSWGSVHWQYLEDMSKVTPHEGTPVKLKKTLWVKETTSKGQVLKPVTGPLAVGDELVVRLELRTDRDMEFIHLKDQRGSGTEPVAVLSRYKYQDGLGYYESTRDTASHYFIENLRKGVYVFEHSVRVQLKGRYQTGIAAIQCMYAPEFNSHSESIEIEVK